MMLSERLKTLRKEAGLTQEEVAKKLEISRPAYTYWEKGEKKPTPDKLTQIANLFGVSTDYLLNNQVDDEIDLSEVELLFRTTSKGLTEEEQVAFKKELIEFMKKRKKMFEGDK
ncbi:helix-turn-helix transcriptional regulator [Streptococcus dysgalactiae subsp. equisimilis]